MENAAQEELKAHLMATNDEFRRLCEEHSEYDEKLEALEAKHALTEQDQMEEVHLKKLKLHAKDLMMEIMLRHKPAHV
ncbi:MAG: YdcH family protein [Bryobacteraceae bacterium]